MEDIEIGELKIFELDQINRLHKTRPELDANLREKRTELLKWVAFNNPYADQRATYFVAKVKSKIVAYHGRMPTIFNVMGKQHMGYYVHDLYVDPEFRKKGLGIWLTMALAKAIEENSDSFICLFGMTPLNLQMQRRRKYYELSMTGFIKYLTPDPLVIRFIKKKWLMKLLRSPVKLFLTMSHFISICRINRSSKYRVSDVKEFSQEIEDFYKLMAHKMGVASYKTAKMLNWKFVNGPSSGGHILVLKNINEVLGFAVLSKSKNKDNHEVGYVMEFMVDPENSKAVRTLIKRIISYFASQNCDMLKCIMSDERFGKYFKTMGFFKRPGTKLLLGNLSKTSIGEYLKRSENWHMTLGEADAHMLYL